MDKKVIKRNIFGWKTVVNYNLDELKELEEWVEFLKLQLKESEPELREQVESLKAQVNNLLMAFGGEEAVRDMGYPAYIGCKKLTCCQNQSE